MTSMTPRVCVYGAGAIGGLVAARLARAGQPVACVARGAHLAAMQANGLRLVENGGTCRVTVHGTDRPQNLGVQDIVFLALKSHALADAAPALEPLLGPETTVVCLQNGIPWWYFHAIDSPFGSPHLDAVDPGGRIWASIGPERAVGAVVYLAAQQASPGEVRHLGGERISLGEPDGTAGARLARVAALLTGAGIEAPVLPDIRRELWHKLSINAALNPLGVVCRCVIGELLDDPAAFARLTAMIGECQAVARALGIEPVAPPAKLAAANRVVGGHKTSMLIDFERRRPLEIDALTGAVTELGRRTGVATPELDAIGREVAVLQSDAYRN